MSEITNIISSPESNKNSNKPEDSIFITAPIEGLDEILAKLSDPSKDPFEKMYIVMSELMPAITEWKEDELEELGGGLEQLAEMTDSLARLQDHFNTMQEGYSYEAGVAFKEELDHLTTLVDESTYLDDSEGGLKDQLQKALGSLDDIYTEWGGAEDPDGNGNDFAGSAFVKWTGANSWNKANGDHDPSNLNDNIKPVLDEFNKIGTGLKNTSGVVQARFQFEVGNYESYIGIYKDMFKTWKNQLQSPLDGIKRAG